MEGVVAAAGLFFVPAIVLGALHVSKHGLAGFYSFLVPPFVVLGFFAYELRGSDGWAIFALPGFVIACWAALATLAGFFFWRRRVRVEPMSDPSE